MNPHLARLLPARASRSFPILLLTAILLSSLPAAATDFFVSPSGSSSGDGSLANPWDLATALAGPASVLPGDTIWLRGGTYHGTFTSKLSGTSIAPITVRRFRNERATLDGGSAGFNNPVLYVQGQYTWFWGFEIMTSDTSRVSQQSGSSPTDLSLGGGITTDQTTNHPGLKFINLIVHDTQDNGFWKQAVNAEINGCLFYYNGWSGTDRGHGHGIYAQNDTGSTMRIIDNILFQQFDKGIQIYGSATAPLNNMDLEGNTAFQNGYMVSPQDSNNIEIGGGQTAQNPTLLNNYSYYSNLGKDDIGYSPTTGTANLVYKNNYAASGNDWPMLLQGASNPTITGNTFRGHSGGFSSTYCSTNTCYLGSPPPSAPNAVFVRPNQHEPGRANITVYNWSHASTVDANVSAVLQTGDTYEVHNAQNYFGAAVLSGVYSGSPLHLPMTGLASVAPVGWPTPAATGPEFNAFVLLRTGTNGGAPAAHFSVAPSAPAAGQTVSFVDTSDNTPTSWSWNFGDPGSGAANTSTQESPTHVYATAGHYSVSLTVTNAYGTSTTSNGFDVH
jgi:parallel beta-helix repeat protein